MPSTGTYFINSPVSGVTYYGTAAIQIVPDNATSYTVEVKMYNGANGTGGLRTVTSLKAINRDVTAGVDRNSFTGGSANTTNASSSSGTNGTNVHTGGGMYTGSAGGSMGITITSYTGHPYLLVLVRRAGTFATALDILVRRSGTFATRAGVFVRRAATWVQIG